MANIKFWGKSDVGLRRFNNEDAFVTESQEGFSALADGMGGEAGGEIASQIFVETASEVFSKRKEFPNRETLEWVKEVFELANQRIFNYARENPSYQRMGCTAELVAFDNQHFVLGHVGDSRTYLLRKGAMKQLTRDHSLVQEQVEQGLITPGKAKKHSLRNVLLRAVGIRERLTVDLIQGESMRGDLFLLCSDGLTDMVNDTSIQETLSSPLNLTQKVGELIEQAKSAGGFDNVTVILCEMMGAD
jgi:PPM family protein phosphatase